MKNDQERRTSWGRARDVMMFAICVGVIGLAAAMRWRAFDMAFGFAVLGFYAVGSSVLLWRL